MFISCRNKADESLKLIFAIPTFGVQPSMGEIFVARGKTTKEWRPGLRRTEENRPTKELFKA